MGLRKKIKDNKHFAKESNVQETVLLSPSLSPTISYFQSDSVRQDEIFRSVKSVSGASLLDPDSPQYAALQFVLDEDPLHQYISDSLTQRYSIAVLFFSWKLDNEINGESECKWKGILCENDSINQIILRDSNLFGSIPDELTQLSSLVLVDLSRNFLKSTIPSEISSL